eukprot:UN20771
MYDLLAPKHFQIPGYLPGFQIIFLKIYIFEEF